MRITQKIIHGEIQAELFKSMSRLQTISEEMASGKRIRRPSDDPLQTVKALSLRRNRDQFEAFLRNADDALSWLRFSDSALEGIENLISRAREIAIDQANAIYDQKIRANVAAEVRNILSQMLNLANSSFNGRYIFAGSATTSVPFSEEEGGFVYRGNSEELLREIGPGDIVPVNAILSDKMVNVLNEIKGLEEALSENDVEGIRGKIGALEDGLDRILEARADVGARSARVEMTKNFLLDQKTEMARLLSETEDADIADVITRFAQEQNAYRIALEVAARIIQPSLIDFLR